ncbi:ankyrin repeat domain-containing protein [Candidatus Micrarchaeota archaeon]|nr:ankyrin repeat domain-containing protein [Candidatus Micrarchaeota archaeon]
MDLFEAARRSNVERVGELLASEADLGISVNARDSLSKTALHYAAEYGHVQVIELLVAFGANVNSATPSGETPLHFAAEHSHANAVRSLISHNADVNAKTIHGFSVLHVDVKSNCEILRLLADSGADLHAVNHDNWSVLHAAAECRNLQTTKWLLDRGLSVKAQTNDGWTVLHAAAEGRLELVELLVARGADVHSVNNNGWTVLHAATQFAFASVDIVGFLLSRGVNVTARTSDGRTPLDFAKAVHSSVVSLLEQAMKSAGSVKAKAGAGVGAGRRGVLSSHDLFMRSFRSSDRRAVGRTRHATRVGRNSCLRAFVR